MSKGLKKRLSASLLVGSLMLFTLGTGIASATIEHPDDFSTWTYYSSFNVIKQKKSSHSNFGYRQLCWGDHSASAQVGNSPKVKVSVYRSSETACAVAYGSTNATSYAWYSHSA